MFLFAIIAVIVLAWVYILFVREALVALWPGGRVQWWHEEIEDKLWANSRQILTSRLYWVGGIVVAAHEALAAGGYDYTPLLQQIQSLVPEPYRPMIVPAFLILTGAAFEWLRRKTRGPLQS